ncbi:MAG TPA: hypothetical protein DDW52_06285 [Planctomycetaceae bacterium]|nr:hypothetical protein [Planctomycetaceae bacterium]
MNYIKSAASICIILVTGCGSSTSSSSTSTTEAAPGYATPSEAVQAFYEAFAEQDLEKAKSASVLNDKVLEYLKTNIQLFKSMDDFALADAEFFGAEGAMGVGLAGASALAAIQGIEPELIDETHATFAINPNSPMKLLKGPTGWKVDFTGPENAQFLELSTDAFGRTISMFVELRSKIKDGTLSTRAESRAEMAKLKSKYGL